nr:ribonuclease H-like domain-containing protein [Tanacetum cinerariifolium]
MLADSFLPTTFWAEAVNTACYVLNRVLVTKPQNKTPYELLTGKQPIISYLRPFGCHVTILNTIDQLGKFDGKSDSGFLVGYSLNSKAFRSSGDKIEMNTDFKTREKPVSQVEQIFLEELEKLKRQEKEANDAAESIRKEATHGIQNANTSSTNLLNTVSTPLSTAGPSRAFNDGEISYPDDSLMPHLEDIYASPSEGIFTDSSYDDEVENQANKFAGPKEANNSAGTQANDDQSANSKEIKLHEEHFVLPIWSAYLTNVKRSGDKIEMNTDFKTCEKPVSQVEQIFLEELEKLKRQEKEANDAAESIRKEATHGLQEKKNERGAVVTPLFVKKTLSHNLGVSSKHSSET